MGPIGAKIDNKAILTNNFKFKKLDNEFFHSLLGGVWVSIPGFGIDGVGPNKVKSPVIQQCRRGIGENYGLSMARDVLRCPLKEKSNNRIEIWLNISDFRVLNI